MLRLLSRFVGLGDPFGALISSVSVLLIPLLINCFNSLQGQVRPLRKTLDTSSVRQRSTIWSVLHLSYDL
jgi:hypothetical protein